ncbi:MAG: polyprenyl synthetase family protein [Thermoplasmata archaeon]
MDVAQLYRYLPRLEDRLRASYADAGKTAPATLRPYLDLNRDFTLRGGKRFRAILVLAGYYIATGKDPRPVLDAAAAVEHFQSWMLIHDDIIDHAEERRGGVAVHRALAAAHRRESLGGSADDYGVGIGITLGDVEEPFTVGGLLAVKVPAAARLAALAEYVEMTRLTAYGQLLDIRNGTLAPGAVSEVDVLDVHRLKSAVYTVSAPLKIGALLGGARPTSLRDLESIATDLGVAFQLRDDVLGAGFDASEAGKSANDLIEGKRTLLVIRAWQTGKEPDRECLRQVLGRPDASPAELAAARETIRSTGSLAYSEERIAQLTNRALARLKRTRTIRSEAKPMIAELSDRLTRRRA